MHRIGRAVSVVSLALAVTLAAAPARADWSLGANLGFQFFDPGDGDGTSYIMIPNGSGLLTGPTPGLRLGWGVSGRSEMFSDLGFGRVSDEDASASVLMLTINYQHAFSESSTSPYFTFGAGAHFVSTSFEGPFEDVEDSDISGIFGGGIGVRREVSQGHGAIRGEIRVDYVTENDLFFPSGTLVGLKLGFDLWMR